jgi:hypothetical protein
MRPLNHKHVTRPSAFEPPREKFLDTYVWFPTYDWRKSAHGSRRQTGQEVSGSVCPFQPQAAQAGHSRRPASGGDYPVLRTISVKPSSSSRVIAVATSEPALPPPYTSRLCCGVRVLLPASFHRANRAPASRPRPGATGCTRSNTTANGSWSCASITALKRRGPPGRLRTPTISNVGTTAPSARSPQRCADIPLPS